MDAPTFRVAATALDLRVVNTKYPPARLPHIRLIRNVNNLMGTRPRDTKKSYTVTCIEACLSMKGHQLMKTYISITFYVFLL